jgi:hypothetical protein
MITKHLLNQAVEVAKNSDVVRGKIGAIAFLKNGHIITRASNAIIWGHGLRRTIHGEEFLLYKLKKLNAFNRYGKENIYILVVRWTKSGKVKNAKPCPNCFSLLAASGLKYHYTNDLGEVSCS